MATRPGFEPAPIRPAVLAAGLLVAQQVAGKATRDAFFLSHFDVTSLPLMAATSALLSLLAVFAFARGMAALSPARLVPLAAGASAALLTAEWSLSGPLPCLAAVAVYLHTTLFGATLMSGFWSLVNERFDPHSARRAIGPIGSGASLGGIIGGLITWRAAAAVSVPAMLLGMAALNLLCLEPLLRLGPVRAGASGGTRVSTPLEPQPEPSGLRLIQAFPYLRNLALVVGLCAFVEALVDYVFNAAAVASLAKGQALMSFFALFQTIVALLSLAVQAVMARACLARLGLAGSLAVQPAVVTLGGILVLFSPRLSTTVLLRGAQAVLRNSLFRSAYELLYTPLPRERKRPTKMIVDVGFERLGTAAGSGVVMLVLGIATTTPTRVLLALAVACAALTLALAKHFRRGYVDALADSLRSGAVNLDSVGVVDATHQPASASVDRGRTPPVAQAPSGEQQGVETPATSAQPDPLLEATSDLRSGDVELIARVLRRGDDLDLRLVSHVIPLLAHDELFADVVSAAV